MVTGFHATSWILANYKVFLLVLIRISTILFLMPVFGSRVIPLSLKAAISLMLTWVLAPLVQMPQMFFPKGPFGFFLIVCQELFVAMTLALFLRFIFAGLQLATQMVGIQMGLSIANVMDPQSGVQSLVVTQFAYIIALLLFLVSNGHHAIIRALFESFSFLPPGRLFLSNSLYEMVLLLGQEMFVLSIKLMAPVMAFLFLSQVALGILAKLVPQINMLIVSFSINVALGLFFFGLTIQYFWPVLARSLDKAIRLMPSAFTALGG